MFRIPAAAPSRVHATSRILRRSLLIAAALLVLAGASNANATTLTGVTFTPDSLTTNTPWTIDFTTSGSGSLTAGNVIEVTFPVGFSESGVETAISGLLSGFTGTCRMPNTSTYLNGSNLTVVVPLVEDAGCSLATGATAQIGISGISAVPGSYDASDFAVRTYASSPHNTLIDDAGYGTGGGSFNLAAPPRMVMYSDQTSAMLTPTTSGTPPMDLGSPYVDGGLVTVLGNTGSLALTGYTFAGWCTTNVAADPTLCTGMHYAPGATFNVTADTTLYSQWATPAAADGSGTAAAASSPAALIAGTSGNTLTFTYTAATGGMNAGEVDIVVPADWSAPTAAAAAGCTTASAGTLSFAGPTIKVTGLTLPSAGTLTVTYGATTGGACTSSTGATAQPTAGTATFTTSQKSTAGGSLTALAASPSISVTAPPKLEADLTFPTYGGLVAYTPTPSSIVYSPLPNSGHDGALFYYRATITGGIAPYRITLPFLRESSTVSTGSLKYEAPVYADSSIIAGPATVTISDAAGQQVTQQVTVTRDAAAPSGTISVSWDATTKKPVLTLVNAKVDDTDHWSVMQASSKPKTSGTCFSYDVVASNPPSPKTIKTGTGAVPTEIQLDAPAKDLCVAYYVTATDHVANTGKLLGGGVTSTADVKAATAVVTTVTTSIKLNRDISTVTDATAFQKTFTATIASATGIVASRVHMTDLSAGSITPHAKVTPISFFTIKGKRKRTSKTMKITIGATRAGLTYLKQHPSLQGKVRTFNAPIKITLNSGRSIVVNTKFELRLPKFVKKHR